MLDTNELCASKWNKLPIKSKLFWFFCLFVCSVGFDAIQVPIVLFFSNSQHVKFFVLFFSVANVSFLVYLFFFCKKCDYIFCWWYLTYQYLDTYSMFCDFAVIQSRIKILKLQIFCEMFMSLHGIETFLDEI